MSKAYWVSTYRAVKNAEKFAAYEKLAVRFSEGLVSINQVAKT
jgi:hypothetical protein